MSAPDLIGNPNVFTNKSSNHEAIVTNPGMIPHIITPRITTETINAAMNPFRVVSYFLK